GGLFSVEAIRSLLQNTTYIGYLGKRRDLSRDTRGNWEPIVEEELFEQVQAVRESRAHRGAGAGRPGKGYALSRLLRCERCGQAMHGSTTSTNRIRSYICAGRKQGQLCDQPIAHADAIEDQLAD